MEWILWVFALFVSGFAFGADKHHDWRDYFGPSLMLAGVVIAFQHAPLWVSLALLAVLVMKLLTR